eukprot:maker-scaffold898_size83862-snap-gene-0.16 protein:Tk12463 transcript:maker-scaffold898_size83862-snap-gene-0.16-mRNA-1 annotation:"---NA---"
MRKNSLRLTFDQQALYLGQALSRALTLGPTWDLVLVSDAGEKFPCHQAVLSAVSPILRELLQGWEFKILSHPVVVIPEISSAAVDTLLHFVYTGNVVVRRGSSTYHQFRYLAQMLKINPQTFVDGDRKVDVKSMEAEDFEPLEIVGEPASEEAEHLPETQPAPSVDQSHSRADENGNNTAKKDLLEKNLALIHGEPLSPSLLAPEDVSDHRAPPMNECLPEPKLSAANREMPPNECPSEPKPLATRSERPPNECLSKPKPLATNNEKPPNECLSKPKPLATNNEKPLPLVKPESASTSTEAPLSSAPHNSKIRRESKGLAVSSEPKNTAIPESVPSSHEMTLSTPQSGPETAPTNSREPLSSSLPESESLSLNGETSSISAPSEAKNLASVPGTPMGVVALPESKDSTLSTETENLSEPVISSQPELESFPALPGKPSNSSPSEEANWPAVPEDPLPSSIPQSSWVSQGLISDPGYGYGYEDQSLRDAPDFASMSEEEYHPEQDSDFVMPSNFDLPPDYLSQARRRKSVDTVYAPTSNILPTYDYSLCLSPVGNATPRREEPDEIQANEIDSTNDHPGWAMSPPTPEESSSSPEPMAVPNAAVPAIESTPARPTKDAKTKAKNSGKKEIMDELFGSDEPPKEHPPKEHPDSPKEHPHSPKEHPDSPKEHPHSPKEQSRSVTEELEAKRLRMLEALKSESSVSVEERPEVRDRKRPRAHSDLKGHQHPHSPKEHPDSPKEHPHSPKEQSRSVTEELEAKRLRMLEALKSESSVSVEERPEVRDRKRPRAHSDLKGHRRKKPRRSRSQSEQPHHHHQGCSSACSGQHPMSDEDDWLVDDSDEDMGWEPRPDTVTSQSSSTGEASSDLEGDDEDDDTVKGDKVGKKKSRERRLQKRRKIMGVARWHENQGHKVKVKYFGNGAANILELAHYRLQLLAGSGESSDEETLPHLIYRKKSRLVRSQSEHPNARSTDENESVKPKVALVKKPPHVVSNKIRAKSGDRPTPELKRCTSETLRKPIDDLLAKAKIRKPIDASSSSLKSLFESSNFKHSYGLSSESQLINPIAASKEAIMNMSFKKKKLSTPANPGEDQRKELEDAIEKPDLVPGLKLKNQRTILSDSSDSDKAS